MPVLVPQQSNWENNVYVVTTTRVFIVAGIVYLGRSLYYLVSRYHRVGADTTTTALASRGRMGVDLINIASDTLDVASMDPDVDINVNGDLELGIRQPRPSYQRHHYPYGPRLHRHERPQRPEASANSGSPTPTARVCNAPANVGVDNMRSIEMSGGL